MLKELPREGLGNLMYIFNAILQLGYWPKSVNIAEIIKDCTYNSDTQTWEKSNRRFIVPTNQLATDNFKLLEKLILKKTNKDLNPQDWIPNHQSGFRQAQSTVQQRHRITKVITKAMENQQQCTGAFLDVS